MRSQAADSPACILPPPGPLAPKADSAKLLGVPNDSEALRQLLQADTRTESRSGAPAGSFLVPGLTILHHPEAGRVGERVALAGLVSGREESLSRTAPA